MLWWTLHFLLKSDSLVTVATQKIDFSLLPSFSFCFIYQVFSLILQEAMAKDTMERNAEPNLNLKAYLADAYLHPIFHSIEDLEAGEFRIDKNQSCVDTPVTSELSSPSPPHYAYQYEVEPWMGGHSACMELLSWIFSFVTWIRSLSSFILYLFSFMKM